MISLAPRRARRRGEIPLVGHGARGGRRIEVSELEDLLEALAQSPELESMISDAEVLRAVIPAPFVVKRSLGPGAMLLESPRGPMVLNRGAAESPRTAPAAERAHAHAHSLRALGVRTPTVLAWMAPENAQEGPSWWITPYVLAPSLAELRDAGVWGDPQERRRCVRGLAEAVGKVHRHGWVAPRLYPNRVLVDEDAVVLLDPESLLRGSRAARQRELLRISEDFSADEIGPLERHHFLKRYLGPVAAAREVRARWVRELSRLA